MTTATDKLTAGQVYDQATLRCIGWTRDGEIITGEMHGYSCWSYFGSRGEYLGPDQHGVEPLFSRDGE